MDKRKTQQLNIIFATGLGVLAITLLLKQLIVLPDFVSGLGIGLAIGLELVGLYAFKNTKKHNKTDQ